ncbi:MAG TPA: hypothetical protein VKV74_06705 [Bryobacteraceae bacterium]|nr:hypothetical protein [Bryobacteraceae bacterium]
MASVAQSTESGGGKLTASAVRDQMERILESEIFSRSERLTAFLRFAVTETLEGRGETLKEQVIAASLYLNRQDSRRAEGASVRADARRLRDKLREYYAEFPQEPVVISLQKGSYAPRFSRNAATGAEPASAIERLERRDLRGFALIASVTAAVAIAALAGVIWTARPASAPLRIVPLTQLAGGEEMPSLSPDGNFVAFQHWDPPGPSAASIWIRAVNREGGQRLTNAAPAIVERNPAWSPDGTEIAFERAGLGGRNIAEQGVFVVSVLGGPERKISGTGGSPRWGANGQFIYIRDGAPSAVFQIDLTTLARRRITNPEPGDADGKFDISPNGATIAFIRSKLSGVAAIYLAPAAGGPARQLTAWGAPITGLAWTADGEDIVYAVRGQSLWRIQTSSRAAGKGRPVEGLESLKTAAAAATNPTISRPAKGPARLAFQIQKIDVSMQMVDLTSASGDTLRATSFLDAARVDIPGAFSPDGERVLYHSYLAGAPVEVWMAKRDGSGASQIRLAQASHLRAGSWSPDGERFVFEAAVGGATEIYTASRSGGGLTQVTSDRATAVRPCWSPDGKWIYYASNRSGSFQIWKSTPEGGGAAQITREGGMDPALSMDGNQLFYLDPSVPSDPNVTAWTTTLKTAPADGGEEMEILPSVRRGLWGVTQRGIFFLKAEGDSEAIELYHPKTGKVTRIGRLPFVAPREFSGMAFSRDGRWALANRMDHGESDLMMIEDFR